MDEAPAPQFSCFSLQKPVTPCSAFVSDVGSDGSLTRRRKAHTKSRYGCLGCKSRRIKCDEGQPCRNCKKRNLKCCFNVPPKAFSIAKEAPIESVERPPPSPSIIPTPLSSPINLEHMRLLHHFQVCTFSTFVMDPGIWKDSVITLALQNSFLMHAVFLVTVTHLQHLQPNETRYQLAALEHLSQALPMFRQTLAADSNFTGTHGEALIACAMLLLQYSWTYGSEGWSSLVGLYRGMKTVVLEFLETLKKTEDSHFTSMFTSMLSYSPRMRIERHFQNMRIPSDIEDIFTHILSCTKISHAQPDDLKDFIEPSNRLKTILFALRLGQRDLEASGLELDVARYLFSWLNLLPSSYVSLIARRDERAQVLMLYYFAAVSRLRAERFWWMKERGSFMFEAILNNLGDKCTECTDRAQKIFNAEDAEGCGLVGEDPEGFAKALLSSQRCPTQDYHKKWV